MRSLTLGTEDPIVPEGRRDAAEREGHVPPAPPVRPSGKEPVDVERLQSDPAYRRAYEDWLDLRDNLARPPAETRRVDLIFLAATLALTALLALLVYWLLA